MARALVLDLRDIRPGHWLLGTRLIVMSDEHPGSAPILILGPGIPPATAAYHHSGLTIDPTAEVRDAFDAYVEQAARGDRARAAAELGATGRPALPPVYNGGRAEIVDFDGAVLQALAGQLAEINMDPELEVRYPNWAAALLGSAAALLGPTELADPPADEP